MAGARSVTTFYDDLSAAAASGAGDYATKLSEGGRTVVAHGATPEESRQRAAQVWEIRDEQLVEARAAGADERLKVAFQELVFVWEEETAHLSSPLKLIQHPAYRQIIGLGAPVLPLLLEDLVKQHRFWFAALSAITGENPIPAGAEGDIEQMIAAWQAWGHDHGLV